MYTKNICMYLYKYIYLYIIIIDNNRTKYNYLLIQTYIIRVYYFFEIAFKNFVFRVNAIILLYCISFNTNMLLLFI